MRVSATHRSRSRAGRPGEHAAATKSRRSLRLLTLLALVPAGAALAPSGAEAAPPQPDLSLCVDLSGLVVLDVGCPTTVF